MKKMTHTISVDIQNVINYENVYMQTFDPETGTEKTLYQGGIFPNLNYKIQF